MYDIQGDDVDFSKKKIFEKLMANFDLFEKMTKENFDGLVINFFYYDKNKIRYQIDIEGLNQLHGIERLGFKEGIYENQDLQNAFKYFNFKFYWQAAVLFQKVNDHKNANL